MLPIAAAAYSENPLACVKKFLPNIRIVNTYSVKCSTETETLIGITTSWIAYFLDQMHLIDYNSGPIFSSNCHAFIGIDDVEKVITMGFRGTIGIFQLLEQFLQYHRGLKPFFNHGKIYEYFYNAFHLLWNGGMEKGVREVLGPETQDYELWITGISLGGALATVTTSYIAHLDLFPPSRIKLITFGQPRVSDYDHSAWRESIFPYSFRVINGRDPIPHLPPKIGPFALFHDGTEIWYPAEMWQLSNYKMCAEADGDYCSNSVLLYNIMDHIFYFEIDVGEWGKLECKYSVVFF